jgi:hypothetical protein
MESQSFQFYDAQAASKLYFHGPNSSLLTTLWWRRLFYVVFLAPAIEEFFKRRWQPWTLLFIVAYETTRALFYAVDGWDALAYLPTALMHLASGILPLEFGFLLHASFNLFTAYWEGWSLGVDWANVDASVSLGSP